jgi:hypothetical protein
MAGSAAFPSCKSSPIVEGIALNEIGWQKEQLFYYVKLLVDFSIYP